MAEITNPQPQRKPQASPRPGVAVKKRREANLTRLMGEVDRPFLILVVALVCIGSVMVFSASYPAAESKGWNSFYFARRQLIFAAIGVVAMAVSARFADYVVLKKFTLAIFLFALALNVATAIPGIGSVRGGARRWLEIGISFQPSEVLKFALILMCARHISDNSDDMQSFKKGILPIAVFLGLSAVTTVLQRHLSGTIILCMIVFAMLVVGGARAKYLLMAGGGAAAGLYLVLQTMQHSLTRIKVWRNPAEYASGAGYQPLQSLYAISTGGFWGLGLGQSNQKQGYLPEPHNDYIFSILCEELGYFGAFVVLLLFALLIWRGMVIAKNALNVYSAMMVSGIMCSLAFHVLLNIAVVTNTIPSTGIGLPFFSYGGTSLIIWMAEMGVVLSVSRYSYLKRG